MYINPFIAGVMTTIFAEMALLIAFATITYFKNREGKDDGRRR